jgi:uncharacterized integral membrane protein (TIGR00698 family)
MGLFMSKILYFAFLTLSLMPFVKSHHALLLGLILGIFFENPFPKQSAKISKQLLKLAVIGLGFGVPLYKVVEVGKNSILFTFLGIIFVIFTGYILGKYMKIEPNANKLISFGTAICGGSAIAALSPVINAEEKDIAVSLGVVFSLNALGLLIFPIFGHLLEMSQHAFGVWAALAIHDTSSVVGATSVYGNEALMVGTTVKLSRALWIAPFVIFFSIKNRKGGKINLPYFILFFILAAFINSYFKSFSDVWHMIYLTAKQMLVVTLFLIGTGISRETLKKVGLKPIIFGIALWIIVGISSYFAVTVFNFI